MSALAVDVLGPVRARRDGVDVDLASPRQRALLAALAVAAGRPVSVGELVDAVWDEDPPEGARATLQTYVSRLRQRLGSDAIQHGPAGYRLDPEAVTDLAEVRRVAVALERGEPRAPLERVEVAVAAQARWQGPALAELAERRWFRGAVAELAEMRARLGDLAAEGLLDAARPASAVSFLEAAVGEDPLREPTVVLLVRALHGAGRTTDALRAADRYRRELRDQVGLDPGPALAAAEQAALVGEAVPSPTGPPVARGDRRGSPPERAADAAPAAALPRPPAVIGRADDLAELARLVGRSRLVTITGVGGVGKTTLLAELLAARPGTEPWTVVELGPVSPGGVAAAVAAAVGYRADRPDAETLSELLRSEELVLVLDNCEHVLDEARELARALVSRCPSLRLVTTSRVRLDLPTEVVLRLDPLDTAGEASAAAVLFAERVARGRPRSPVDPADPAVAALCQRLDGVPLALELAASRAAALGVGALTDDLGATLDMLMATTSAADRHDDLAAVVAWSVDLLGGEARSLLRALGAFQGEFDLEAAEAVAGDLVDTPVPLLLGVLVDASLVAEGTAPGRFRLLEMIRRTADRGAADDGAAAVRRAHARWLAGQLGELDSDVAGPLDATVAGRLDVLRPEVLASLSWARAHHELDAMGAVAAGAAGPLLYRPQVELLSAVLGGATDLRDDPDVSPRLLAAGARSAFLLGRLDDAAELAETVLEAPGPPDDRAARHRARHALGVLELYRGRFDASATHFRAVADDPSAGVVERLDSLGGLALALCYRGAVDEAGAVARRHHAMADTVDSDTYRAFSEYAQAEIAVARGDIDGAATCLEQAAERAWGAGATFVWGLASTVLASVLVHHRPDAEARHHLPVLLERWRRTATWPQLWTTLRLVAVLLARDGAPEAALTVLIAADRDPAAPHLADADEERDRALRAQLRDELGVDAVAGIEAAVAGLDRVAVLERAVAALTAPAPG